MHHYFETITNTSGESLSGYFARVIDPATQVTVTLSSDDNGTPIASVSGYANLAKSDDFGNLDFYVAPGVYHLDIYARDATTFVFRVPNVGMDSVQGIQGPQGDPGEPGPAGNIAADLAQLQAAAISNVSMIYAGAVYAWTEGDFTGGNSIDYVESDDVDISDGAWVRQPGVYQPTDPDLIGSIAAGTGLRDLAHTNVDTGQGNTAFGIGAGDSLTTGRLNTLTGYLSGRDMTALTVNNTFSPPNGNAGCTFYGAYTGVVANGAYDCTLVGTQCGLNLTSGMDLVGMGINCLKNIEAAGETSAFGHAAFEYLVGSGTWGSGEGHRMAAFGDMAGRFLNNLSTPKTGGNASLYVGARTTSGDNSAFNENVIGYAAAGNGSNTFTLGNTNVTFTRVHGTLSVYRPTASGTPNADGVRAHRPGVEASFAYLYFIGDRAVVGGAYSGGGNSELAFSIGTASVETEVARFNANGWLGIGTTTAASKLDVPGSIGLAITTVTTSTTLDGDQHTILCDATAGNIVLTLPTAASAIRRCYVIKKIDASANTVTIDGNGAELIDGATTQVIPAQWAALRPQSDGAAWYLI